VNASLQRRTWKVIDYAPFDTKQTAYLIKTFDCWLNVAEGGKRAGKNILNIIAFAENLETHPDKIHLVGGVTKPAAMMNIIDSNGFGLLSYFDGRIRPGKYPNSKGMDCYYIQTKTGEKVVIVAGGKDSDDYRAIKGNTYGSAYVSEANECHKFFIQEVFDRTIASNRRKLFFDLNSKPPRHWFYTDILDFQDELAAQNRNPGYNYAHFTIYNNRSITDEQLREVLRTYDKTSLWYQADILGKRTAATGRIYTGYKPVDHVIKPKILREIQPNGRALYHFIQFSIGVDVGGTDATVATCVGFTSGYEDVVLVDGYYHKQGKESFMDHAKYAAEICDKIELWIEQYPLVSAATIFAESADKLFRQALVNELKKRGLHRMQVLPAYKKEGIVDRIRLNNILINQDRFRVASHMKSWQNAYENAMWSDEDYEEGEWVRVDDGSYPVDCLDSTEYAIHPYKKELLKGGLKVG
jgi:PBSX family phage terminase large subunit